MTIKDAIQTLYAAASSAIDTTPVDFASRLVGILSLPHPIDGWAEWTGEDLSEDESYALGVLCDAQLACHPSIEDILVDGGFMSRSRAEVETGTAYYNREV